MVVLQAGLVTLVHDSKLRRYRTLSATRDEAPSQDQPAQLAYAVAIDYRMSLSALATTLGLPATAFYAKSNVPEESKPRLEAYLAILGRVEPWSGSRKAALAWYRDVPIPSLGNLTAEQLVQRDDGALVLSYLDAYADGAYA